MKISIDLTLNIKGGITDFLDPVLLNLSLGIKLGFKNIDLG